MHVQTAEVSSAEMNSTGTVDLTKILSPDESTEQHVETVGYFIQNTPT